MNKIHIEVVRTKKQIEDLELQNLLMSYLNQLNSEEVKGQCLKSTSNACMIQDYVETITFDPRFKVPCKYEEVSFHFYCINDRAAEIETLESDASNDFDEIPASHHWLLPSKDFLGLWETLLYEEDLKENILKFIETALKFSILKVNTNLISCNRIILLHGPPGTGKTSLCRALAQKCSIRLQSVFKYTHLVEINSHSLFSKWFSESGKLVMKLFSKIKDLISQPRSLVCVLIDEVESLTYARKSISGSEPRDALRVVNALLTQLDQIKNQSNVLILTTSNLSSNIDLAFIDRADIKQYIGYPSVKAIYEIYKSAIRELNRVGIIQGFEIFPFDYLDSVGVHDTETMGFNLKLQNISQRSYGLSGRNLRKIPFIAHAYFVQNDKPTLEEFLSAIEAAVQKQSLEQNLLDFGKCDK